MPVSPKIADAPTVVDCVVVGAGPGGLTAATYLARFRRAMVAIDAGDSRAKWIPSSHNCPGFPSGVNGIELLARMSEQARAYGATIHRGEVTRLERDGDGFVAIAEGHAIRARTVILATGDGDILPAFEGLEAAIACGALRLCAICDAYEAIDRSIAIHAPTADALGHALFARTFSSRVSVVPTDGAPTPAQRAELADAGIEVLPACTSLSFDGARCAFAIDGQTRAFDVVYPFLGSLPRSELATGFGARRDEDGALVVDRHQMTSVDGLYAIGDVVSALNQISVATGHAAIAATAIHNRLPPNFA